VVPTYEVTSGTAYFRAPPFGELARRADRHVTSLQVDDIDRIALLVDHRQGQRVCC